MRLENTVAFISGGARGMGAAEARLFSQEGAKVVIGDVLDDDGRQTESEINELGGECLYVHLDVKSEESWASAISETVDRFRKLDILVNNAGVASFFMLEELSVNEWDRVMDINAKGVFLGTKAAIPEMRRAGGGSIINISSICDEVAQAGYPHYIAAKGGVKMLTKAMALDLVKNNIRVNALAPGAVETATGFWHKEEFSQLREKVRSRIPMGRPARAEEMVGAAIFLASEEESGYVTGISLPVDGGYLSY